MVAEQSTVAVSIVIPIYRVAPFIERCVISLMEQRFDDLEFIFVNDATDDNSIDILTTVLERYPQREHQVKIIHNPENLGLFEARKVGVMAACGEYIQHVDSDDWIAEDMTASLYQQAKATQADIVVCDYYIEEQGKRQYRKQILSKESKDNLLALFDGKLAVVVWNKLIKKEKLLACYQLINFSGHINLAEDWLITFPLCHLCHPPIHLPRALYHYNRHNPDSLTRSVNIEKSRNDKMQVLLLLYQKLHKQLNEDETHLFIAGLAEASLKYIFLKGLSPNLTFLRQLDYNLLALWQGSLKLRLKIVFSFYFLGMPWIPKQIKYFYFFLKQRINGDN